MELIEKLLFIHDTQIKKWGRISGLLSLLGGVLFIIISPILYMYLLNSLTDLKNTFVELGDRVEPGLGQELGNSFLHLETALFLVIVLFVLFGVMVITSAMLTLKVHKRLQSDKA